MSTLSFAHEYAFYAKMFIGLLAIANPIGVIPVFLSMSADRSPAECNRIAGTTASTVAIVLLLAAWLGDRILAFFGIGVPAFLAGGGLLIIIMAIAMLHARQSHTRQSPEEADELADKEGIAVVPLAIPLLAGPGAISLVILDAHQAATWVDRLVLSLCIILLACLVWVSLRLAEPIGGRLGVTGLNIVTRVMGLLLVAIGMQMFTAGLTRLLPGLAGG